MAGRERQVLRQARTAEVHKAQRGFAVTTRPPLRRIADGIDDPVRQIMRAAESENRRACWSLDAFNDP
jgi:hypothetical protein